MCVKRTRWITMIIKSIVLANFNYVKRNVLTRKWFTKCKKSKFLKAVFVCSVLLRISDTVGLIKMSLQLIFFEVKLIYFFISHWWRGEAWPSEAKTGKAELQRNPQVSPSNQGRCDEAFHHPRRFRGRRCGHFGYFRCDDDQWLKEEDVSRATFDLWGDSVSIGGQCQVTSNSRHYTFLYIPYIYIGGHTIY